MRDDRRSALGVDGMLGWRGPWAFVARFVVYAGLWWVITGGAPASWLLGVPAAAVATALAMRLDPGPTTGLHLVQVLPFIGFFLRRSVLGGLDVARRALAPSLPVAPGLLDHQLRLPADSPAARFYVGLISLLPGTLCARFDASSGVMLVHVVDRALPNLAELRELEMRVARLFGLPSPTVPIAGAGA